MDTQAREMIAYFSEGDVRAALPMSEAVAVMRDCFRRFSAGEAPNQPRRRLFMRTGAVLHSMAGEYGRYFGTKFYSTHPKHGAHFLFFLYDAETARPLAQFEANHLGQIRTGAATGVAVDTLAPQRPLSVALIGSGFQARTQLEAVLAVRPVRQLQVWSRKPENRVRFADQARDELGVPAVTAATAADALKGADVVITATYAKDPVIEASDVPAAALVAAMGSNHPQRRELPAELVRAARLVVDSVEQARIEAGDLLLALEPQDWERVEEIGKTKAGHVDRLTVFKSVGLGVQDVAAAAWIWERSTLAPRSDDPHRATR